MPRLTSAPGLQPAWVAQKASPSATPLEKLDKTTGGTAKRLMAIATEGIEEWVQEFGQDALQDSYDKLRGLDKRDWKNILGDDFSQANQAGLSGVLMGLSMNAAQKWATAEHGGPVGPRPQGAMPAETAGTMEPPPIPATPPPIPGTVPAAAGTYRTTTKSPINPGDELVGTQSVDVGEQRQPIPG